MVVSSGSTVTLAYRLLSNEQELESASKDEPVSIRLGEGDWPIQVELAMMGEAEGARINVPLAASDQAFGQYDPARVQRLARDDFGEAPAVVGSLMAFHLPSGEEVEGVVTQLWDEEIEVDFNHPYAGRDLYFEIDILAIQVAEAEI